MPQLTHIFFNGLLVFLIMCMNEVVRNVAVDRGQVPLALQLQVVVKCLM